MARNANPPTTEPTVQPTTEPTAPPTAPPAAPPARGKAAEVPKVGAKVLVHYLAAPGPREASSIATVTAVRKDGTLDLEVPKSPRQPRDLQFERVRPGPAKLAAGPYWVPTPPPDDEE